MPRRANPIVCMARVPGGSGSPIGGTIGTAGIVGTPGTPGIVGTPETPGRGIEGKLGTGNGAGSGGTGRTAGMGSAEVSLNASPNRVFNRPKATLGSRFGTWRLNRIP